MSPDARPRRASAASRPRLESVAQRRSFLAPHFVWYVSLHIFNIPRMIRSPTTSSLNSPPDFRKKKYPSATNRAVGTGRSPARDAGSGPHPTCTFNAPPGAAGRHFPLAPPAAKTESTRSRANLHEGKAPSPSSPRRSRPLGARRRLADDVTAPVRRGHARRGRASSSRSSPRARRRRPNARAGRLRAIHPRPRLAGPTRDASPPEPDQSPPPPCDARRLRGPGRSVGFASTRAGANFLRPPRPR